jgi:hypothetical protein
MQNLLYRLGPFKYSGAFLALLFSMAVWSVVDDVVLAEETTNNASPNNSAKGLDPSKGPSALDYYRQYQGAVDSVTTITTEELMDEANMPYQEETYDQSNPDSHVNDDPHANTPPSPGYDPGTSNAAYPEPVPQPQIETTVRRDCRALRSGIAQADATVRSWAAQKQSNPQSIDSVALQRMQYRADEMRRQYRQQNCDQVIAAGRDTVPEFRYESRFGECILYATNPRTGHSQCTRCVYFKIHNLTGREECISRQWTDVN